MKKSRLFFVFATLMVGAAFMYSCQKTAIEQENFPQLGQVNLKSAVIYDCSKACLVENLNVPLQELTLYYVAKPKYGVIVTVSQVISEDPTYQGISLRYTFTSTNSTINDIHRITIDGKDYFKSKNSDPAAPKDFHVDIPLNDWTMCETKTAKIEVRRVDSDGTGPGQYLLFNTSVKLIPICTTTEIESDPTNPVCIGTWVNVTGTVKADEIFPFSGGEIQIQNQKDGQIVARATVGSVVHSVVYSYKATSIEEKFIAVFVPSANGFKPSNSEEISVATTDCGGFINEGECENVTESFTYIQTGDTYDFTYIPSKTVANAKLKLTLPGSDTDYDSHEGWSHSGESETSAVLWNCENLTCGVPFQFTLTLVHKEHGKAPMFKANMFKIAGTCN